VQAIRQNNLGTLSTVPGIGRKKAERLVLELRDKFDEIVVTLAAPASERARRGCRSGARIAGLSRVASRRSRALAAGAGTAETASLVRGALQRLARVP
jgi:Holliday junction DNA helicase RuvA